MVRTLHSSTLKLKLTHNDKDLTLISTLKLTHNDKDLTLINTKLTHNDKDLTLINTKLTHNGAPQGWTRWSDLSDPLSYWMLY